MKKLYTLAVFIFLVISVHAQWVADTNVRNIICNVSGTQYQPRICSDNHHGAFIAWTDYRTVHPGIYMQHIDSLGYTLWTTNGMLFTDTTLPFSPYNPDITSDGNGRVILVFARTQLGGADHLFATRVDGSGNMLWPTVNMDVFGDARNPEIHNDGMGGAIINWYRYPGPQIFVQWIDSSGQVHLPANGLQITNSNAAHYDSHAAIAGDGTAYVAWEDYDTLRLSRFDTSGNVLWPVPVTLSNSFSHFANEYALMVNANHDVIVFWKDVRAISPGLYAQRIDTTGAIAWIAGGQPIDTLITSVNTISLTTDGNNGNFVSYGGNTTRIQRVGLNGQTFFNPVVQTCSSGYETYSYIRSDSHNGAIVVWQDGRGNNGVYAQRIDTAGNLWWRSCGSPVYTNYNVGTNNDMHAIANDDGTGIAVFLYVQGDVVCAKVDDILTTGMEALHGNNLIQVFPNPANDEIHVVVSESLHHVQIKLFDVMGQLVLSNEQTNFLSATFSVKNFEKGIYFLSFQSDQFTSVKRMVVN
ncbi:MAG: T9SS type A sorting domain-containing protein [Bacteroidetes bacterium]|nr:T9SS type A sorting domain-containing protein [Bacteroidota bacterium]